MLLNVRACFEAFAVNNPRPCIIVLDMSDSHLWEYSKTSQDRLTNSHCILALSLDTRTSMFRSKSSGSRFGCRDRNKGRKYTDYNWIVCKMSSFFSATSVDTIGADGETSQDFHVSCSLDIDREDERTEQQITVVIRQMCVRHSDESLHCIWLNDWLSLWQFGGCMDQALVNNLGMVVSRRGQKPDRLRNAHRN
jgi:hypothetical protein